MEPIVSFTAPAVALPIENIDTDQIIPARYLKVTDKNGLGEGLFAEWRNDPEFILNQPHAKEAGILVAGHNFGCGSSREHAPWALLGFGFKAVVSTYFADIFKNNALKNGLLPIVVDSDTLLHLVATVSRDPESEITVDLANQQIQLNDEAPVAFPIDAFSKHCLLHGVDQLGYIQAQESAIAAYEARHPARLNSLA
jgi:3-isopropylmalate/(R)-2-methylmalate dehydratase small subunit